MTSPEEQHELLLLAREAVTRAVTGTAQVRTPPRLPGLSRRCGVFVTLKAHGELRGCIGHIESHRPVGELVGDIAVRSALDDPRFPPLQPEELEAVTFQISLLSPLHRIGGPEDITVGRHGLLLELGPHRGLLLPQVAVEFGWTAIEFLEATARKAGLHREAWRDRGAMLSVFTAEIIDEAVIGHGTPADHPAM